MAKAGAGFGRRNGSVGVTKMRDFRRPETLRSLIARDDDGGVFEIDMEADVVEAPEVPLFDDGWMRANRFLDPTIRGRFLAERRATGKPPASPSQLERAEVRYAFDCEGPAPASAIAGPAVPQDIELLS